MKEESFGRPGLGRRFQLVLISAGAYGAVMLFYLFDLVGGLLFQDRFNGLRLCRCCGVCDNPWHDVRTRQEAAASLDSSSMIYSVRSTYGRGLVDFGTLLSAEGAHRAHGRH